MSIIPSIFGGRRSNVYDPFSLDIFDPFRDFPFPISGNSLSVPRPEFANETAAFANTRIDWRETPEAHVFKADLPGLKKEEVKVEVEEGKVLQISGERSKEKEEKSDTWHRMERSNGKFLRRFRLPENTKVDQVKAAMENGVLTVTVPKEELKKAEAKSIQISGNIIMVDQQQDAKKKGTYEQWTKEESDLLLELMVEAATRGWRDNSGILTKQTVEERILPVLNEKLGCHKTYNNYQSRLKWFKNRWISYSTLMRFNSGFGFDFATKKFTASDEVWEEYFKAHPKDTDIRYGTFRDYEDLEIAIGNGVAVGKNSIGLGSVTDARTLGVGESRDVRIEDFDYDVDNDAFVRLNPNDPSFHTTSPLQSPETLEVPMQRTTQKKRNRTEYEGSSSSIGNTPQSGIIERLDQISTSFQGIYNLLEKREREREYTIWDAIKDTPNLEEDTRFKAVELLDTKGKKDVFLKMSPEERSNWIRHKMRGL